MTSPFTYPRHPAHLDAYVEVLGPAMAVRFFVEFGGGTLYFPDDPKGKSAAEALIGPDNLRALAQRMPSNRMTIPMPRPWLILALTAEGKGTAEIVRLLKTTDRNVRSVRAQAARHLPRLSQDAPADPPEAGLPLFDHKNTFRP